MSELPKHRACPVCNADVSSCVTHADPQVSDETFTIATCGRCGYGVTVDAPPIEHIGRYYDSPRYLSHYQESSGILGIVGRWIRNAGLKRKRRFLNRFAAGPAPRVLDIGCGTGLFLRTMRDGGWEIAGTELMESARRMCEQETGVMPVEPDAIFAMQSGSFDAITFWHSLEHIHDAERVLRKCAELLAPGGVCIVNVPNPAGLDARCFGTRWTAYDVPRHIHHFTPDSMCIIAERNGLHVESVHPMFSDILFVCAMSAGKGRGWGGLKGMPIFTATAALSLVNPARCGCVTYVLRPGTASGAPRSGLPIC